MAKTLLETTAINFNNVSESIRDQVALYASFVEQHRMALDTSYAAKRDLDLLEANLDKSVRAAVTDKKLTEAQVAHEITRDKGYIQARAEADNAHVKVVYLQNVLQTLRQRHEILTQFKD